jgi:hypothetical protein
VHERRGTVPAVAMFWWAFSVAACVPALTDAVRHRQEAWDRVGMQREITLFMLLPLIPLASGVLAIAYLLGPRRLLRRAS